MLAWIQDPNVAGLAYDAAGIFVFGVPAVLMSKSDVVAAGQSVWDYDSGAMRRMIEQRLDTCVGSLMLLAGFAFQLVAAEGWFFTPSSGVASWALLPVMLSVFVVARRRIVERQLHSAIEQAKRLAT